jgi:hypothetical protein
MALLARRGRPNRRTAWRALRVVTIGRTLTDQLKRYMAESVPAEDDALLFRNQAGGPIRHADFLRSKWRPTVERLNLPDVRPHDLRASHASWLVDEGFTVLDVAARLGHSFASVTTRHYARALEGRDADVAAFFGTAPADDPAKAPVQPLPRQRKGTASKSNGHAAGTRRAQLDAAARRAGASSTQRRRSEGL